MPKRSRWESAVAIQSIVRRWLARRRLQTMQTSFYRALDDRYRDSVRNEAVLVMQCFVRQWRARGRVAAARKARDERQRATEARQIRNTTDPSITLFSVWDLPDELVDFQGALQKDAGAQLGTIQFPKHPELTQPRKTKHPLSVSLSSVPTSVTEDDRASLIDEETEKVHLLSGEVSARPCGNSQRQVADIVQDIVDDSFWSAQSVAKRSEALLLLQQPQQPSPSPSTTTAVATVPAAAAIREESKALQCNTQQPGTVVLFPEQNSSAFVRQCRQLFAALDVKGLGFIEERLCVQLMDRCAGPTPFSCRRGMEEIDERPEWARAVMRRVLEDTKRLTYRNRDVDHRGRRIVVTNKSSSGCGAVAATARIGNADTVPNGELRLPFDAFCMYMMAIVRE